MLFRAQDQDTSVSSQVVSRDQRGSRSSVPGCIDATQVRLHQCHALPLALAVESEVRLQCETGD